MASRLAEVLTALPPHDLRGVDAFLEIDRSLSSTAPLVDEGRHGTNVHVPAHPETLPTAFMPFALQCPPAPRTELTSILHAQEQASSARKLAKNAGAGMAVKLIDRGLDHIERVKGPWSYYIHRFYTDLPGDIHHARMDLEQAAQNAHENAEGSSAGDIIACAADDLMPYDPNPNIHPMDTRLGSVSSDLLLAAPCSAPTPETPCVAGRQGVNCSSGARSCCTRTLQQRTEDRSKACEFAARFL